MIVYLITKTVQQTGEVWSTFGVWGFITGTEWIPTPVTGPPQFGALPFIYGTLMTAFIAMVLAVPAAVGVALATTVFLPRRFRAPGREDRSTCSPPCPRWSTACGASPSSCPS